MYYTDVLNDIHVVFQLKDLVYYVLYFTSLLMEHAYARHLYSSIEVSVNTVCVLVRNIKYVLHRRIELMKTKISRTNLNIILDTKLIPIFRTL